MSGRPQQVFRRVPARHRKSQISIKTDIAILNSQEHLQQMGFFFVVLLNDFLWLGILIAVAMARYWPSRRRGRGYAIATLFLWITQR